MDNGIPIHGGYGETDIHPIALVSILISGVLILLLPRRYVIIPIIFMAVLIPMQQRVVLGGLNFMIIRIMIMFAYIRIILRSEFNLVKLNSIDKVVILWVVASVVSYTLLWQTGGAFINRLGFAYNAFGIYFLFRILVLNLEDIDRVIRTLTIVSVLVAICMLIEQETRRNIFFIFGGVPEFTQLRAGNLRAQGAFTHPILAGMFGATLMPLFVSLWWQERYGKKYSIIGIIAATIIVVSSSSTGPAIAYLAGIAGLCMWVLRKQMRKIRWIIVISLISLHIIMKAPVWALIARIEVITGSTSYHRYLLIDQFISRINEWWLLGVKSTDHWGWMMWDTVNQYVSEGTEGGLLRLILFIIIITLCFKSIGLKIKATDNRLMQLRLWAFGTALFTHLVGFIGISYFDQTILFWYMLLAMISTLSIITIEKVSENSKESANIKSIIPFMEQPVS